MRVAVYGGSFDPPHVGHLMVAAWLRWTDRSDAVWLLPTFAHPFAKSMAPFDVRRRWCEAVAAHVDGLQVCAIEAELPAPSYSVDTLGALARRHPEHRFRFVLGADLVPEVDGWKDWAGIEARFDPVFVGRQGHPTPLGAVDFPDVSSTEIRRRVAWGEPVDHLVPACILDEVSRTYGPGGSVQ